MGQFASPLDPQPSDAELQRLRDKEWLREAIGSHLRVNPWDGHWREPILGAVKSIMAFYERKS